MSNFLSASSCRLPCDRSGGDRWFAGIVYPIRLLVNVQWAVPSIEHGPRGREGKTPGHGARLS